MHPQMHTCNFINPISRTIQLQFTELSILMSSQCFSMSILGSILHTHTSTHKRHINISLSIKKQHKVNMRAESCNTEETKNKVVKCNCLIKSALQ